MHEQCLWLNTSPFFNVTVSSVMSDYKDTETSNGPANGLQWCCRPRRRGGGWGGRPSARCWFGWREDFDPVTQVAKKEDKSFRSQHTACWAHMLPIPLHLQDTKSWMQLLTMKSRVGRFPGREVEDTGTQASPPESPPFPLGKWVLFLRAGMGS